MGLPFIKSCGTKYSTSPAPAPNPRPDRWKLLACREYAAGYVLLVKYLDATNFEGLKVMVYRGKYKPRAHMDPHFTDKPDSPIARFRPDADGIAWANDLAASLK